MEKKIIGSDFMRDNKKYFCEKYFAMTIKLNKTCYFKGETIKGNISLKTKEIIKKSLLYAQIGGNVTLEEIQNYRTSESGPDIREVFILFKYPISVPKFDGKNLMDGIEIPFQFTIPINKFPSCLFNPYIYIKHVLIFDLVTIETVKSIVVVIKNNQYFSQLNCLYKSPSTAKFTGAKYKYGIFPIGVLSAILKLAKNSFSYDETIPFIVEVDCSNFKFVKIIKVHVAIIVYVYRTTKGGNFSKSDILGEKLIIKKTIPLTEDKKIYLLQDEITLPKENPSQIYKALDLDQRCYSEKFKNVGLYSPCYGGLITCKYFMRVQLETNTLMTQDEYFSMEIEFYEKEENNTENNQNNNQTNEIFIMKPIPDNIGTPIGNCNVSNLDKKHEQNKIEIYKNDTQNNGGNKINNNSNEDKKEKIENNNFNLINEKEDEGDAPPSVPLNNNK